MLWCTGKRSAGNHLIPDLLNSKPVGSQTPQLVLATLQRPRFGSVMMEKTFSGGLSRMINYLQQRWEIKKVKNKISLHRSVPPDFCTPTKSHVGARVRSWAPPALTWGHLADHTQRCQSHVSWNGAHLQSKPLRPDTPGSTKSRGWGFFAKQAADEKMKGKGWYQSRKRNTKKQNAFPPRHASWQGFRLSAAPLQPTVCPNEGGDAGGP